MELQDLIRGLPTQQYRAVCTAYIDSAYDRHRDFLADLKSPSLKKHAESWLEEHVKLAQSLIDNDLINPGIGLNKARMLANMDIKMQGIKNNYQLSKDSTKTIDREYHTYTR